MAHIIILDEFGNEIGREEHPPEGGRVEAEDHPPVIVRLDIGKIIDIHGIKAKEKDKS